MWHGHIYPICFIASYSSLLDMLVVSSLSSDHSDKSSEHIPAGSCIVHPLACWCFCNNSWNIQFSQSHPPWRPAPFWYLSSYEPLSWSPFGGMWRMLWFLIVYKCVHIFWSEWLSIASRLARSPGGRRIRGTIMARHVLRCIHKSIYCTMMSSCCCCCCCSFFFFHVSTLDKNKYNSTYIYMFLACAGKMDG